ncbi:putative amine oxidase [Rhexocercosporidium sp. MPI-PUGE-AT-0058]|nr:putative amine oxidase [Rhexocercosporidium sp. MPI-PUGE-AT-0058]
MQESNTEVDVVIVGAGLSGLSAAVALHEAGLTVMVLEAKDRVGGKTYSISNGEKGIVELGAAWINDTNQSEMWALAQKYGFETVVQRAEGLDCVQDGDGKYRTKPYGIADRNKEEEKQVEALIQWINAAGKEWDPTNPSSMKDAAALDAVSFKDYCDEHFPGGVASYMAGLATLGLLGVEATEISALFMVDYIKSGTGVANMISDGKDGGQYLRNRRGNLQFSKHLAAELNPGSIKLSHPVTSIEQVSPGHCVVKCNHKLSVTCKKVIVSTPTCLYKDIKFSPSLPPSKAALASGTHMGYTSKAICIYSTPWWRNLGLSGVATSNKGPIEFTRDTCILEDENYSIVCFIVGDAGRAWSNLDSDEQEAQVIRQMKKMFAPGVPDGDVPEPTKVILQDWAKEEYIWGAPSAVLPLGALARGAVSELCREVGDVHFVGTETSDVWKGYMEGAVRSGRRGAREVMDVLVRG